MNDEKISTDNSTPDNIEETRESVPDPKANAIKTFLWWSLWWVLPAMAWAVICGGTALYASDHTSRLVAILIGLLVGTVVMGLLVGLGFKDVELTCISVIFLIVVLIDLPLFMQARQRAIQRQKHHIQQEMKQNRSQREVAPTLQRLDLVALFKQVGAKK